MSGYQRSFRKNPQPSPVGDNAPARKRPRVGSLSSKDAEDDDDPFADDDITGEELEEWEFVASQAEIKLTQEQSTEVHKVFNSHSAGGITNGSTFKAPPYRGKPVSANSKIDNLNSNSKLTKELEAKLALYEKKIKDLEQSFKRKDGETMVLRDRLSTSEKNLNQERMKILNMQQKHDEAEAEREKQIQRELEKYKDQVQFKDAEIMESQNLIRNLEAKNKLLEQEKTRAGNSTNIGSSSEAGSTKYQEEIHHAAIKKIRRIKPESPRMQSNNLIKANFDDDPLGSKKGMKCSPFKTTSVPSPAKSKTSAVVSEFKLKSKYLSKKSYGQRSLWNLVVTTPSSPNDITSPVLHLLRKKQDSSLALQSLKRMLNDEKEDENIFGSLCQTRCLAKNLIRNEGPSEIMVLTEIALSSYLKLQDSLLKPISSQETQQFHTTSSNPMSTTTSAAFQASERNHSTICGDAYAALQVLHTSTSQSTKTATLVMSDFPGLLQNALKICDSERWHPRLELYEEITLMALSIVAVLAKSSKDCSFIDQFTPFVKMNLLLPLLHNHITFKCHLIDALTPLIYHPPFAAIIIKRDSDTDCPALLCRICNLLHVAKSQNIEDAAWHGLLLKVIAFLSLLVAKHESLLIEHSRYSDIYHATDILLYNELAAWKRQSQPDSKRTQLVKCALCLLHSCTNVYVDGIPGSRRDHRHQYTLTNLEAFLAKDPDRSSFWSQELSRIVNSEVKAIFEEVETS